MRIKLCLCLIILATNIVYAEAPIFSTSNNKPNVIQNNVQKNANNAEIHFLVDKIQQLEQELQQLNGKIEVLEAQLKQQTINNNQNTNIISNTNINSQNKQNNYQTQDLNGNINTNDMNNGFVIIDSTKNQTIQTQNDTSNEVQLYDYIQGLIKNKQFSEAVTELKNFLQLYPNSKLTANVWYWLGEVYLSQNNLTEAELSFNNVATAFKTSPKAADSLYKIGKIKQQLYQNEEAKAVWQFLINTYPNTPAANLAVQNMANL